MIDFELYQQVQDFYQDYAMSIDSEQWDKWIDFFVEDCVYKIQSRDNFDNNFPLSALALSSKGMLKDRIYGITETIYHEHYYQTHVVSTPRILKVTENHIESEARYAVFRTKQDGIAEVYNVGRYIDRLVRVDGKLLIESRRCIFDNEMILNSVIYPI